MQINQEPSPEALNKLFVTACEEQQQGRLEKARKKYLLLLSHVPDAPVLHYNLGLVHYEIGDYENAKRSFTQALALSPQDMDALYNLALSQKNNGELEGAIASYQKLLGFEPENSDALYNLGGCYKDAGQFEDAAGAYLKVLDLNPSHLSAANNAAYVFHRAGEIDRAVACYRKVLQLEAGHPGAAHMLSALTGTGGTGSPDSYIKDLFDSYSKAYDHSLDKELRYSVPEKLLELYNELRLGKATFAHGLDLGCGTGLCGAMFADKIRVFDGVDLSPKMIALAAAKKIYDRLETDNVTMFLQTNPTRYDFFLAADVLGYIGDLDDLFGLLKQRARSGCLFGFSTENSREDGFRLMPTGRFAHSPRYVRKVAVRTGWTVVSRRTTALRKEREEWVEGMIWFLAVHES